MFCKTCGQQVADGQPHCPNCGTFMEVPVGYTQPAPTYNPAPGNNPAPGYTQPAPAYNPAPGYNPASGYTQPAPVYNPAPTYNPGYAPAAPAGVGGATGFKALGSNVVIFFISVGLLFLNMIFTYCPTLAASIGFYSESAIIYTEGFWTVIGILQMFGYMAGIALCMLPIMTNKTWSAKNFLCGRITCMVALSFFLLIWIIEAADAYYSVSVYATFWGWMFMLSNIGAIVLSFIVPGMLSKKPTASAPVYNAPQY